MRNDARVRTWEAVGGACCYLAAAFTGVLGLFLIAACFVVGVEHHAWLRNVGNVLLFAMIPLILISGCCLDWSERKLEGIRSSSPNNFQRRPESFSAPPART
jgi:hypothetical protein